MMIEMENPNISISRQCELLALNRSSLYYKKKEKISSYDLHLMRLIDEQYNKDPFLWLKEDDSLSKKARLQCK